VLSLLLTHLSGPAVDDQLRYLHDLAPGARFVVCHGGSRDDFDRIAFRDKLFIEDPTLRDPLARGSSVNEILTKAWDSYVAPDPDIDAVFAVEFDQIILRGDYELALEQLLEASGADFLGKNCALRDGTNWVHAIAARHDPAFMAFLERISVRDGPFRIYGGLGTGFVMRRAALEAFRALDHPARTYVEMYVPTAMYHLGFRVEDLDAISDIADEVVYAPSKTFDDVLHAKRAGHFFIHPFKELDRLPEVLSAPGPGKQVARQC
jgi:hypothetical protein